MKDIIMRFCLTGLSTCIYEFGTDSFQAVICSITEHLSVLSFLVWCLALFKYWTDLKKILATKKINTSMQ